MKYKYIYSANSKPIPVLTGIKTKPCWAACGGFITLSKKNENKGGIITISLMLTTELSICK